MKSEHILEAMTDIEDSYIVAVQKRLEYMQKSEKNGVSYAFGILRRVAVLVFIFLAMMSTMFVTAMTVSEEFRELVFQFLHIEQQEIVPEPTIKTEISLDNMYVEQERIRIGNIIEGTYVHTPSASYAQNGVYLICTDEVEMKQGSHYDAYYESNGEFIKIEEATFCQDYTILGNDFHVEFDWVVHNGAVIQTYVEANVPYRMPNLSGSANAMLFWFECRVATEENANAVTQYPVLINLETGELTDVLVGTGAEKLLQIGNSAVSEDLSKMLFVETDGSLYYVDIMEKKLYSIDELSGEHADSCSLIGNTLACWVWKDGYYKAWSIDLVSLERTEVFDFLPDAASTKEQDAGIEFIAGFDTWIRNGDMYAGSSFALKVDEEKNVYVIDLTNGERIQIEGFVWPSEKYPDIARIPSPDGKKLLLCGGYVGFNYQYIGMLDFEQKLYMEFSRENKNEVQEHSAYWFTEDSIIIRTSATESSHDYYVYKILDSVMEKE